jgi:hypothetical protein
LIVADEILGALADYPVLDDEHFGELEWNAAAADDMPSDAYGTIVERLAY